jgi:hypothetical protein
VEERKKVRRRKGREENQKKGLQNEFLGRILQGIRQHFRRANFTAVSDYR